jgi:maltoporin
MDAKSRRITSLATGISVVSLLAFLSPPSTLRAASDDEVAALKAQVEQMQKHITTLEGQVKTLQDTKLQPATILNTHVLTDENGNTVEPSPTVLTDSFIKSITRNFAFSAYVRAGVQFNGNGGAGNFNFEPPDFDGAGRPRLGNENDIYMELTWAQSHMLGDSPDVMDVGMRFTPSIRYVQTRNTFTPGRGNGLELSGNDFDFVMREAFVTMKNVFKSAPQVTFWGGERFYDRWNIDPDDYYFLDTSGYGAGVQDIDLGFGKLWFAYLGGQNASILSPSTGGFYKHTFDFRIKDISLGNLGKIMLVGIVNFEKGTTFTMGYDALGNSIHLRNPLQTDDAWGIGGGFVYQYDFGQKSFFQLYALFGRGATNFAAGDDSPTLTGAENAFLLFHPSTPAGEVINVGNVINNARQYRAGAQLVWNATSNFSVAAWAFWNLNDSGFIEAGTDANGVFRQASGNRNLYVIGVRPVFWLADNIAIEGQAWGSYVDNNRTSSGTNAFGRSGSMGVFTIAPVIKPKGGFFTRPELRLYATYSIWSDSLKGATTPAQESNGNPPFMPPYNGNTNQGWLFGTQVEWFF